MAKGVPLTPDLLTTIRQLTGSKSVDGLDGAASVNDTDRGHSVQGSGGGILDVRVTELQRYAYIFGKLPAFGGSGVNHAKGLVPDPGTSAGTAKFLREDGGWFVPAYTVYNPFGASGASHAAGLVPDPGTTAGSTRYLREDGFWAVPASSGGGSVSAPRHPGYVSTNWYRPGRYSFQNAATGADFLYAIPLVIDQDTTLTDLGVRVVSGAASTNILMGIYSSVAGRPGTLIASTPAASTSTSSVNATSSFTAPLNIAAGVYWVAAVLNGAPTLILSSASDTQITTMTGQTAAAALGASVGCLIASSPYANGLPATAPTMATSTSGCPVVHFKVQ